MDFEENPDVLRNETRNIMVQNHAYFIDTHVGHRAWDEFVRREKPWSRDHRHHNNYMLVIRKRVGSQPPIRMHSNVFAMHSDKIIPSDAVQ